MMLSMRTLWRRFLAKGRAERGQSVTEYALAISVIVTAVVAAGWSFYTPMQQGIRSFDQKFETYYATQPKPN